MAAITAGNDIALRDLEVSRHHAELRRNPATPVPGRSG